MTTATAHEAAAPLLKDVALCLALRPFGKTSQMVVWLTARHGLATTPVKGAQRPKGAFLGRCDVGYLCEVVLYARERNGVRNIRECTPLLLREGLRADWRAAMAADYACDLTLRTAQPGMANPALFRDLGELLDTLPACAPHESALALQWFECRLLHAVGLGPDFAPCPLCPPSPRHTFSVEEGRFACAHRPSRLRTPPTRKRCQKIRERESELPLPFLLLGSLMMREVCPDSYAPGKARMGLSTSPYLRRRRAARPARASRLSVAVAGSGTAAARA